MTMRNANHAKAFVIILVVICMAIMITPLHAQGDEQLDSVLTMDPLAPQPVGARTEITARLSNVEGRGNPNKVLIFYLNGESLRRIRTDENGVATVLLPELRIGMYTVQVVFEGTQAYRAAIVSMDFEVRGATLSIVSIPPLPNIEFSLDGELFATGEDGIARIQVADMGTYSLEVLLPPDTEVVENTRATFDRWKDGFQPQRSVTIHGDISLEAGFAISHPVSQTFIDLQGQPVEQERIEAISLKGTDGSRFTFPDGEERWLRAGRVARRSFGLELAPIQYSIESVMITGSNVVNQYQQRFFVEPREVWPIQLLLYHAVLRAKDALFGFSLGTALRLEYPNGYVEELPFNDNNEVVTGKLARGVYRVQVLGVPGMAPVTPMALSRDQDVDLKVLSALDIGLGAVLGVVGALGLLLYGRPHLPRVALQTSVDILLLRFLRKPTAVPETAANPAPRPMPARAASVLIPQPVLALDSATSAGVLYGKEESSPAVSNGAHDDLVSAIIDVSVKNPWLGRRQVAEALQKEDISISPSRVRAVRLRYKLETFDQRVVWLKRYIIANRKRHLTSAQHAALDRVHEQHKLEAETFAPYPGYLGTQDSFYVGHLEGLGHVYQQTFIDVHSGLAFVRVYNARNAQTAIDMLEHHVLPWFRRRRMPIRCILTDRGKEYTALQKDEAYTDFLATWGISHSKTVAKSAQHNRICSRFHREMRKRFYTVILEDNQFQSLGALQQEIDVWIDGYNSEFVSKERNGLTPVQAFLAGETPLLGNRRKAASQQVGNGTHAQQPDEIVSTTFAEVSK